MTTTTTAIELDSGILEKLMSNASSDTSDSTATTKKQPPLLGSNNKKHRTCPVLQVLNIQNIASPLVNLNSLGGGGNTKSQDLTDTTTHSNKAVSSSAASSSLSSDRYLLILSDGVYYETTCLLLPNLNHLIGEAKLRKGSIVRLERYELNVIPNGKVLVIEELTVLRNATLAATDEAISAGASCVASDENERKSIMNNNLAETLRSIGIIGGLFDWQRENKGNNVHPTYIFGQST